MALIIDEIQKAPILLEELKKTIDSQRLIWFREGQERQLMYILFGSNRFELQQGISDSLAGRCATIEMDSFSQVECHQQQAEPFNPSVEFLLEKSGKEKFPTLLRHKSLKIFFMDTGLCSYLCRWPTAKMLEDCAMNGAFFETHIVSELVKNFRSFNKEPKDKIFYYRDIDKKEIDLLCFMEQNTIIPIEIKLTMNPKSPTRHFSVLSKYNMPIQPGLIVSP